MKDSFIFIGVDVAKDELVISLPQEGQWTIQKIKNTPASILRWTQSIPFSGRQVVLESTGTYSDRLVYALHQAGIAFSVIPPSQGRAFARALHQTNKNDDLDAKMLSIFGQRMEPKVYNMPSERQKRHKEILSVLDALHKQRGQLQNQIHAFSYRVNPHPAALQALEAVLAAVEGQIKSLEEELALEPPEEEARLMALMTSVKSVGVKTATAFVAYFGSFASFDNVKQFCKAIGVCPAEFQSGKSVRGKSSITKSGSGKLRALLFNCARSAIQYNQECKELYQRLVAKGKNGKVALTAVMHKIARLIFGVVKNNTPYQIGFAAKKSKKIANSLA